MTATLSEEGIKQALSSSFKEELRPLDKVSTLPDVNDPREKAHEGWITIASNAIASRVFSAITEKDKSKELIMQTGVDKARDILRVSRFSPELGNIILEITERTLKILLTD